MIFFGTACQTLSRHEVEQHQKEEKDAYLNAKRAEEEKGDISRLTLYEIKSKMRIVRSGFGDLDKVTEIDEAAVSAFIRGLPHAARGKAGIATALTGWPCTRTGRTSPSGWEPALI